MSRSIVVVGAGISGALAALRLSQAGHRVTVVEARHPGAGSSSRSAAAIRQQFSSEATVRAMRHSVAVYQSLTAELGIEGQPLVQNGYLFLYQDPAQAQDPARAEGRWEGALAGAAMQRRVGVEDVEVLDRQALRSRFPWVGAERLIGATWCPSDGFVHPGVVYHEALKAAAQHGAVVRSWSPVVGPHEVGGRLAGVVTERGGEQTVHEADLVINATNAWAPRVSALLGGSPLPIEPLKRYLYFLRRSDAMSAERLGSLPLTITPQGAYCRPENDQQLLCGWAIRDTASPQFRYEEQDDVQPGFHHAEGIDNHGVQTWLELSEWLPPVGGFAGLTATTSGFYGTTPDHSPFLCHDPARPGLIHAAGFSGHGVMMAPFTADALVTLVADPAATAVELTEGVVPLAPFALGRRYAHTESLVI